jgi:lysylphosphatidylglycerol synthetase-like protein (DUF2156 family)
MAVLAEHNPEDAYKNDYHGHPNYIMVFIALVIALIVSMVPNFLGWKEIPSAFLIFVFVVAAGKALLVAGNFMHIKYEPKMLWGLVGFSLFCFAAFFFGVLPDVNHRLDCKVDADYQCEKDGEGHVVPNGGISVKNGVYPEFTAYSVVNENPSPAHVTVKSLGITRGKKMILDGHSGRDENGEVFYHKHEGAGHH